MKILFLIRGKPQGIFQVSQSSERNPPDSYRDQDWVQDFRMNLFSYNGAFRGMEGNGVYSPTLKNQVVRYWKVNIQTVTKEKQGSKKSDPKFRSKYFYNEIILIVNCFQNNSEGNYINLPIPHFKIVTKR